MVLHNINLFWIATVFLFFDFLRKILILSMLFKEFDKEILIESYVEGKELTVSIIGNEAYNPVEIIPNGEYYDFNAKYNPFGN